jgi:hypothetical protein
MLIEIPRFYLGHMYKMEWNCKLHKARLTVYSKRSVCLCRKLRYYYLNEFGGSKSIYKRCVLLYAIPLRRIIISNYTHKNNTVSLKKSLFKLNAALG